MPVGVLAQGMFHRGVSDEDYYGFGDKKSIMQRGTSEATGIFTNEGFGDHVEGDDITNETFGVSLTSGVLIMLGAGAGYATIKSKKRNKKN